MFRKSRKHIHNLIESIKAAFLLFVVTVEANTATLADNTAANKSLIDKFDEINKAVRYLARAKKNELERSGHKG